jgi:hypothetical protein
LCIGVLFLTFSIGSFYYLGKYDLNDGWKKPAFAFAWFGIAIVAGAQGVILIRSALLNSCSENVVVISIVVSELKLSDVQMQIFLADLVVGSHDAALEDRPETFNRIGVNRTNDVLANGMIDGLMREAAIKPLIAGIGVSAEKAYAVRYGLPHEAFQRESVSVFDNASNNVAFSANCADDWRLSGIAAPARSAFLVPMPVFVAPADIGLIDLNDPAEFLNVLDHGGSDLVAHKPSGFVRAEAHIPEDLEGAPALDI